MTPTKNMEIVPANIDATPANRIKASGVSDTAPASPARKARFVTSPSESPSAALPIYPRARMCLCISLDASCNETLLKARHCFCRYCERMFFLRTNFPPVGHGRVSDSHVLLKPAHALAILLDQSGGGWVCVKLRDRMFYECCDLTCYLLR